jgi:hypothetical protein
MALSCDPAVTACFLARAIAIDDPFICLKYVGSKSAV